MQGGEGNTREQAGDTLLQVAEGQRSDQSDQAPSQHAVRLAAAAVHANPLAVHGLQFRLDREDEDLDVGKDIPTVAAVGSGNTAIGRRRPVGIAA